MGGSATPHDDFASFYSEYARTGVHAATAALLTLSGLLASVASHWGFVAAGVALYVAPPAYLYAVRDGSVPGSGSESGSGTDPGSDAGADGPDRRRGSGERTGTATTDRAGSDEPDPDAGDSGAPDRGATGRSDAEWTTVDAPVDGALHDCVAVGAADGAAFDGVYAAGAGGCLLARRDGEWTAVFDEGPAAEGATLRGVAASDDGRAVWVAGDGGALGVYDVADGRHVDFSAPRDQTSAWTDVAVAGDAGSETVTLVNGSGAVMQGARDGSGTPHWDDPTKPGSGSSLSAVRAGGERVVACDTNGSVFESRGGGFERAGIEDADALHGVALGTPSTVTAVAADGRIHRRADGVWTPEQVAEGALHAVDAGDAERVVAGDDGTVATDEDGWATADVPTDATLHGVALVPDGGASALELTAVGDDGTVLERRARAAASD